MAKIACVCREKKCTCNYIQNRIDEAKEGETVLIESKVYTDPVILNKTLNLIAEEEGEVTLLAEGEDVGTKTGIKLTKEAEGARVIGFGIESWKNGIEISASSAVVANCELLDNHVGILVNKESRFATLINNIAESKCSIGLVLYGYGATHFGGQYINNRGNGFEDGTGILFKGACFGYLEGAVARFNDHGIGFTPDANTVRSDGNIIRKCTVKKNEYGFYFADASNNDCRSINHGWSNTHLCGKSGSSVNNRVNKVKPCP
jgi:parallel beta-helix repeat protein